eukprot:3149707-Pyramimonas_sp.AAC.1
MLREHRGGAASLQGPCAQGVLEQPDVFWVRTGERGMGRAIATKGGGHELVAQGAGWPTNSRCIAEELA